MLRNFEIEKSEWENFKRIVGHGNASATIRNFILSYSEKTDLPEKKLRKEFEILDDEYQKIKKKWEKFKVKIDVLDEKRKVEELAEIKKQEKLKQQFQKLQYETSKKDLWRYAP